MKTEIALPAPVLLYEPRVKKCLIQGIIFLTSDNFRIFVGVIAVLILYMGVALDDAYVLAYGAATLIAGFAPGVIRETARDVRQQKLGLKNEM